MSKSLDMDDFEMHPVSGDIAIPVAAGAGAAHAVAAAPALKPDPLGPLAKLRGTWKGTGFNQIWRPFNSGGFDRFLELNETSEVLQFVEIPGDIPNRGLLQADILLHGLTYLQKINDVNVLTGGKPSGIHIEPGIWISVPTTTNPGDPSTVARLANIPHGTSLTAQGSATVTSGPPVFAPISITPFVINQPANLVPFPNETTLTTPSTQRTPKIDIPHVTQAMVDNPNVVLASGLLGKTIKTTTTLKISTVDLNPPTTGGGTSNIAFLQGAAGGPNAVSAEMDATFWIEEFHEHGVTKLQLQYSQRVLLNFNGLSWPHVSVATLIKQ
jgi:hypothetical protein